MSKLVRAVIGLLVGAVAGIASALLLVLALTRGAPGDDLVSALGMAEIYVAGALGGLVASLMPARRGEAEGHASLWRRLWPPALAAMVAFLLWVPGYGAVHLAGVALSREMDDLGDYVEVAIVAGAIWWVPLGVVAACAALAVAALRMRLDQGTPKA